MKHDPEYFLIRIIIIIGILGTGFFGAKILGKFYYQKLISNNPTANILKEQYENKINLETNPYELAKIGMVFLKSDDSETALRCFAKTTELDPLWRDGWVWRGYGELKLGQPKEALASLKNAEKIDPIYPLTYQLLTIAYQQTGDTESAKYTQEKLTYLSKSYKK